MIICIHIALVVLLTILVLHEINKGYKASLLLIFAGIVAMFLNLAALVGAA